MTRQEAAEILLRYRPGTPDAERPEVEAALAVARRDPEWNSSLQEQLAFNDTFRRSLRVIQPPAALRQQILSERAVAPGLGWMPRRLVLGGCIAAIAVMLGAMFWWPRPAAEGTFASFRSRMVRTALRGYAMDLESRSAVEVRRFLGTNGGMTNWVAPSGLSDRRLLGCAVFKWQDQPASMVCYGQGDKPDLWLFIVADTVLPDPPPASRPWPALANRMNTLGWTEDGLTYLLVGKASPELLRRYAGQSG